MSQKDFDELIFILNPNSFSLQMLVAGRLKEKSSKRETLLLAYYCHWIPLPLTLRWFWDHDTPVYKVEIIPIPISVSLASHEDNTDQPRTLGLLEDASPGCMALALG